MGIYTEIREYIRNLYRLRKIENNYQTSFSLSNNVQHNLKFTNYEDPLTSIIIPLNSQVHYTINCIESIYKNLPTTKFEIILVNDNYQKKSEIPVIEGVQVLNNDNIGFVKSINNAIIESKGKYIYLLGSNCQVHNGFLDELQYVFNNYENVGTVGSMLLNTNGSLQEAGSFYLYGHQQERITNHPIYSPEINYIYQVDHSSSHSLLFEKTNDNGEINFLDEHFSTANFSSADLCFSLKNSQNKKNYFTPFSKVTNHEKGIETLNTINKTEDILRQKDNDHFQQKWKKELNLINAKTVWERIQELYTNKSIVFFHYKVPQPDNNSGELRLTEIIKTYAAIGYHCAIVAPSNKIKNNYNERLQRLGVRVYYEHKAIQNYQDFFKKLLNDRNQIWFSTSDIFLKYYNIVQKCFTNSTLIFDMVDVHHLRYERALEIDPHNREYKRSYKKYLHYEIKAAEKADVIITISEDEKKYMSKFTNESKLLVISNIHYSKVKIDAIPNFQERKDLLFIGSSHHPNIDAINFLIDEIMPNVWKSDPHIKLNIVGDVNKYFKNNTNESVIFLGYVPIITDLFLENRIMVAPLRYGAGVKGKIGQALEYYLPVVTSKIGAEGMFLEHETNALLAENAECFANEILRLYYNEQLWKAIQNNIDNSLTPFSIENLIEKINRIETFKK